MSRLYVLLYLRISARFNIAVVRISDLYLLLQVLFPDICIGNNTVSSACLPTVCRLLMTTRLSRGAGCGRYCGGRGAAAVLQ